MCTGYYHPHVGGIERYVLHISRHLHLLGWEVAILTTKLLNEPGEHDTNQLQLFKVPSVMLAGGRMPVPKFWHKSILSLLRQLKDWAPDIYIIHTHLFPLCLLSALHARLSGKPILVIGHGSGHITSGNGWHDIALHTYEHFMAWGLKKLSDKFTAVSNKAEEWWSHFGIDSYGTIYNGIETSFLPERSNKILCEIDIPDNATVVSFAARLFPEKGAGVVLRTFLNISKDYPNVYLVIAGDGPEMKTITSIGQEHPRIRILGEIKNEKVLRIFGGSDIFIYPSSYPEGLPTCVLEAGAMECAVIATPAGGTSEVVINSNYGRIINTGEEAETALRELLNCPHTTQKIASNLRLRILSTFSWNEIVPVLEAQIFRTLQKKKGNDNDD
jgi:glycosyltransferase involved in cell wall biosynthesis